MFTRSIFTSIVLAATIATVQAQPVERKEGGTCYVNGDKGVYTVEDGPGHLWCKVGNRETECGGETDRCSDSPPRIRVPGRHIFDMTRVPSSMQ